jgi:hypothetical protein
MIEPFKYILQAVAIERDDDTGRIVREIPAEPVFVYSAAEAMEAVTKFEENLAESVKEGAANASR